MCQPRTAEPADDQARPTAMPISVPNDRPLVRRQVAWLRIRKHEPDDDRQRPPSLAPQMNTNQCCFSRCVDPLPGREQSVGVAHGLCLPRSGPRMGPTIDVPDPLPGQMRVQLGRGDTRMSEQLLDDAQVGAALEQMRRERVAERVRADPPARARLVPPRRRPRPRPAGGRAAARGRRGTAARRGPGATWRERRAAQPAARPARSPSQSSATSPTGTSRSLSPLPMTRTNAPSTERSSRSSPIASLTRRPAA